MNSSLSSCSRSLTRALNTNAAQSQLSSKKLGQLNRTARALVFPGQGSQFIGMGKTLADNFQVSKLVFEEADNALNFKLSELIFNGNYNDLSNTENAQPAIVAVGIAAVRAIEYQTGYKIKDLCSYVLGHSIGEYTALVSSGSLSLEDGKLRGEEMKKSVDGIDVSMVAIVQRSSTIKDIAISIKNINDKIAQSVSNNDGIFKKNDIVQIATVNTDSQFTLSGTRSAVEYAIEFLNEKFNAVRAVSLPVSVPFHCDLMIPAADKLKPIFNNINFKPLEIPLVSNFTGLPVESHLDIPQLLVHQTYSQVKWYDSLKWLSSNCGIQRWLCPGPSPVISNIIRKSFPDAIVRQAETTQNILDFANVIKLQDNKHAKLSAL
ncbi:hypothetical protein BB561_004428 [Smittium simulii]|uniref:[acyl-carrier-protein] S-malonyltransferase n=1 Tax=Smittium simulii TaxID=133385 RepID=A0A2T9YGA1_9FUNG|nr:hypothetical protein BB561_004428 [Smittium simulii]